MRGPPESLCRIQQEIDYLRLELEGERELLQQHVALLVQQNLTLADCTREQLDLWVGLIQTAWRLPWAPVSDFPAVCCLKPAGYRNIVFFTFWGCCSFFSPSSHTEASRLVLTRIIPSPSRLAKELQEKNRLIQSLQSQIRRQSLSSHHSSHSDLSHSDRTSSSCHSSPTTQGGNRTHSKYFWIQCFKSQKPFVRVLPLIFCARLGLIQFASLKMHIFFPSCPLKSHWDQTAPLLGAQAV